MCNFVSNIIFLKIGSNISLHVPESGSSILPLSFLSATDIDTEDELLIFEVLTPPRHGSLKIDNEVNYKMCSICTINNYCILILLNGFFYIIYDL